MDNTFCNDEKLYRAVLPLEMFWKSNGKLTSAAFKDRHGLSVERGYYRKDDVVVENIRKNLTGSIISVNVGQCRSTDALVRYLPSKNNQYHSEIHKSENEKLLSAKQCKYLAERADIIEK